jgi:hypothetical protein
MKKYMVETDVDLNDYFGDWAPNVLRYLGVTSSEEVICIYGDANDCEIWDHTLDGMFTVVSEDPDVRATGLSVGWVGYGELNLGSTNIQCLSSQNASPIGFYIPKFCLELIEIVSD